MEVIVEDAEFVTMAAGGMPAQAMLIRDGRIAAVGPAAAVRAEASPGARVARLDGATVIPGLIDAHCHVCDVGYLAAAADCSQPSAPDIPAIQARLRDAVDRTPEGSWVTGGGYVEYKLREGRHPTRADLDQAVPHRPAVVYHTSLHVCVLNTAALREAGFADGQPDPPGGAFGRDREGRLAGAIFEGPMFAVFERNLRHDLTRMGAAQRARVVQMAGQRLYAFGSWRRAGITVAGSPHAPVIIADPLLGLRDAMLRRTGDGLGLGPADRPPAGDALRRHTTH